MNRICLKRRDNVSKKSEGNGGDILTNSGTHRTHGTHGLQVTQITNENKNGSLMTQGTNKGSNLIQIVNTNLQKIFTKQDGSIKQGGDVIKIAQTIIEQKNQNAKEIIEQVPHSLTTKSSFSTNAITPLSIAKSSHINHSSNTSINLQQFSQKQIKRLQSALQKLQEQCEDWKYKDQILQKSQQNTENSLKIKSQEIRKLTHSEQILKLQISDIKNQLSEKDKFYQRFTTEIQNSMNVLSMNYEESLAKGHKLQASLKQKSLDYDNLFRDHSRLNQKHSEIENVYKVYKEHQSQELLIKIHKIGDLQGKLRHSENQFNDQLTKMREQLEKEFKNKSQQMKNKFFSMENMKQEGEKVKNQLQVIRLSELVKELQVENEEKNKILKGIRQKWEVEGSQITNKDDNEKCTKCVEFMKNIKSIQNHHENQKIALLKQIQIQQSIKILQQSQRKVSQSKDFEQLLKNHLFESTKTKKTLHEKTQQIHQQKTVVNQLKCQIKSLEDEITLLNKKIITQQRNSKVQLQVSKQNLTIEVQSLKRKLCMGNNKIEQKTKQLKQKQAFIINTIVGRSRAQDALFIKAQLLRVFEAEYNVRLDAANRRIHELEGKA